MTTKVFQVVEYSSFFAVRHILSGVEKPMGDGVDTLFNEDGVSFKPGTPDFVEIWTESLNQNPSEVMEAYFKPSDFFTNEECPDCGEDIPPCFGDECENCGHVFFPAQADD